MVEPLGGGEGEDIRRRSQPWKRRRLQRNRDPSVEPRRLLRRIDDQALTSLLRSLTSINSSSIHPEPQNHNSIASAVYTSSKTIPQTSPKPSSKTQQWYLPSSSPAYPICPINIAISPQTPSTNSQSSKENEKSSAHISHISHIPKRRGNDHGVGDCQPCRASRPAEVFVSLDVHV